MLDPLAAGLFSDGLPVSLAAGYSARPQVADSGTTFSEADFLPSPTYAVPCDTPSEGEVADAVRKLRNNKAPGEDGISAAIFKSRVDALASWLHEVIERAWRIEVVPDDWGLGILVPILKKGDKTRCENCRRISLNDVAAKVLAIVLLRRFQTVRDSRTRPNQAGFRGGCGCADQIFTRRRILEFRHSYQQPTAVCFIEFAVTFNSVHRESHLTLVNGHACRPPRPLKPLHRISVVRFLTPFHSSTHSISLILHPDVFHHRLPAPTLPVCRWD
nr:unnamed protein product [Spirometra erinaceieuropaei]